MSLGAYLSRFGQENPELEEDDDYQRWASQAKKAVLAAIQKQTDNKPGWIEGNSLDEQIGQELGGWDNLIQLQRYAAHVHFTGQPPEKPAEADDLDSDEYLLRYKAAIEEESSKVSGGLQFRHLIMTGDQVRYIPLDFPEPLWVEENGSEAIMSIGSSHQLYYELTEINKHLLMVGDYGQLGDDDAWKLYENEEDPWRFVKWAWIVLHWLARESVNKKLSIYFE